MEASMAVSPREGQVKQGGKGHGKGYWRKALVKSIRRYPALYIMTVPIVIYYLLFCYAPMFGVIIAFKNYSPVFGILRSPWFGLQWLLMFFNSFYFWDLIRNSLVISVYGLLVGVPLPIIMALLFEEVRHQKLRGFFQSVSYAPSFISTVVMCGIIVIFLTPDGGIVPYLMHNSPTSLLDDPNNFWNIFVWTGAWQGVGWASLIYTATIAGIPQDQYEAATIDGASKVRQVISVTLPNLAPIIIILFLLNIGSVLNVDFQKALALQSASNLPTSEVISTYVYKTVFAQVGGLPQYSFSAMIGLFNNIISLVLLFFANFISKRVSETSLW